jgi:tetraacyldisaccharide 4'-kinase
VVDGQAGIGNGFIIPAGPLRESLACALRRVGAVVIVGEGDPSGITRRAKVPVLRATLQPELPRGFPRWGKFVAFAGIARPQKFYATARALGLDIADTFDFPDHHPFTEADIDMLRMAAEEEGARLLTTTKDAVRLPPAFLAQTLVLPVALIFEDAAAAGTLAGLIRDLL